MARAKGASGFGVLARGIGGGENCEERRKKKKGEELSRSDRGRALGTDRG